MRLKYLRQKRGISQLKLAMDLNMNQNSISRSEHGQREADYETLIKFADYFNVSIDYLLNRTNNPEMNRQQKIADAQETLGCLLFYFIQYKIKSLAIARLRNIYKSLRLGEICRNKAKQARKMKTQLPTSIRPSRNFNAVSTDLSNRKNAHKKPNETESNEALQ